MSRWLHTCEVCGYLGPYGFFQQRADGSHGRLWACPAHQDEVRAAAGAPVPVHVQAPPAVPLHVPVPKRSVGQGQLF